MATNVDVDSDSEISTEFRRESPKVSAVFLSPPSSFSHPIQIVIGCPRSRFYLETFVSNFLSAVAYATNGASHPRLNHALCVQL